MAETVAAILIAVGALFQLVAAIGVLRMPDLFSRMQAAAKAATMGAGCIVIGAAVHFGSEGVTVRVLLVTAFLLLTAPIATQLVARAAYSVGAPLWHGTVIDELRGSYDLSSAPPGMPPAPERPADET